MDFANVWPSFLDADDKPNQAHQNHNDQWNAIESSKTKKSQEDANGSIQDLEKNNQVS